MTMTGRLDPPPGNLRAEAQELADKALSARRKEEVLDLARRALELDGECTDAQVLLAKEEACSPRELVARLKLIVDRAEARLGAPFLREHRGRLGQIEEAWPYLRAILALAGAHEKAGRSALAIPLLTELLANDPEDRLGARYRLASCLLAAGHGHAKDLKALLRDWDGGNPAFLAWAALLERIHAGAEKGAANALHEARRVNPYFEDYLTGRRKVPRHVPSHSGPGSPQEAAAALRLFGDTWANDREAMYWLFKHG